MMPATTEQSLDLVMPFEPNERRRFFEFQRHVRSLLAIIRSIVRRMAQTSPSVEDFAAHLEGRLGALARVQGLQLRAPDAAVDLEELVRGELLAQAIPDGRFEVSGPQVLLGAKAAATVGLALHELTTNSIKFGALGGLRGELHIEWRRSEGQPPSVTLDWRELTEQVTAAATHRGLGFELIEETLPYELGGSSSIVLHPAGLRCSVNFVIEPDP